MILLTCFWQGIFHVYEIFARKFTPVLIKSVINSSWMNNKYFEFFRENKREHKRLEGCLYGVVFKSLWSNFQLFILGVGLIFVQKQRSKTTLPYELTLFAAYIKVDAYIAVPVEGLKMCVHKKIEGFLN